MISLKNTLEAIKNSLSTLKTELNGKQDKTIVGDEYIIIGDIGICWGGSTCNQDRTLPLHFADGARATASNGFYNTYSFYVSLYVKDGGSYSYLRSYCSQGAPNYYHYIVIGKLK